jgi:hypothetical protein
MNEKGSIEICSPSEAPALKHDDEALPMFVFIGNKHTFFVFFTNLQLCKDEMYNVVYF